MAALSPFFPTSFSLFCFPPPNGHLCYQWRPPLVIYCSASTGRLRASRKRMSDADLLKGLREFVSSFDFPDGHLPSTKELAEHGRKDLANIVRRRGYKIIRELLSNSNEAAKGFNLEDSSAEERNVVHGLEYEITDNINGNFWLNSTGSNSSIQDQGNSRLASDRNGSLINGTAVMSKRIANTAEGGYIMSGNGYSSHEVPSDAGVNQYINKLKELELSQLTELIEKEESQTEDEIKKTEKLIAEMDTELLAAEDSLAGLKEVEIQYLGEGQLVEVAGSFNGWHQRIRMDPQPSTGKTPIESRNLRLWSALLWLYPGEYEIKFVVDGEWKIGPQRETTTRTGMQNNVLRVDR